MRDLFDHRRKQLTEREGPLAARMRPRTLDEFIGQEAIIGPGRLLRRAIQADRLGSLIFYGPPGTGKTTLARIIANTTSAEFIAINAVLAGVKDIRDAVARAQQMRGEHGRRTILFVDEVHRFNKAQQDALLPWVENGTVTLIGATTENPYFEVNKALVSRSRIFRLEPLTEAGLRRVVQQALRDATRGYGDRPVELAPEALDHLVNVANGDARALLNALELAVETTEPGDDGITRVTLAVAEESIQRRAVLYDKEGDAHFDAISAFIKSCRGSDPDAALYWLARMVYAGEDPRFLFRRMLILASEDVGLADPDALARVTACAEAFDRVGLPEGRFHLAQATLVLATAPKSNSTMGFFEALNTVAREREGEVPDHLKDASRDSEGFGHGEGYLYPHAYRDHWVAQQYLPAGLQGQVYYQPSDQGFEGRIREQVARRREAQIAVVEEEGEAQLTTGPEDRQVNRWLKRALEDSGRRFAAVRDRLFERAEVLRHHVVLDVRAASGLLVWEAVRRTPEGGVYAAAPSEAVRGTLAEQAAALPELARPTLFVATPATLAEAAPEVRFDRVLGRDPVQVAADLAPLAAALAARLTEGGRVVLAQGIPRDAQRLHALVEPAGLDDALQTRWQEAEEALYGDVADPRLAWGADHLAAAFEAAGFAVAFHTERTRDEVYVTPALVRRWWDEAPAGRPTYRARLARLLDADTVTALAAWSRRAWVGRTVPWAGTTAWLTASIKRDRTG